MSVTAAVMEVDGQRVWVVTDGRADDAERVVNAMLLRQRGLTLRAIGRAVGRSHEWVRQQLQGQGIGADRAGRRKDEEDD